MDIMEANTRALQVTPHVCDSPTSKGYYDRCDGGGCGLKLHGVHRGSYGHNSSFTIDTSKPFTVVTEFGDDGQGGLQSVTTKVSQGDKHAPVLTNTVTRCGRYKLAALGAALKEGMVVTISYWGQAQPGGMGWLDIPPCAVTEGCTATSQSKVVFSDFIVGSL